MEADNLLLFNQEAMRFSNHLKVIQPAYQLKNGFQRIGFVNAANKGHTLQVCGRIGYLLII